MPDLDDVIGCLPRLVSVALLISVHTGPHLLTPHLAPVPPLDLEDVAHHQLGTRHAEGDHPDAGDDASGGGGRPLGPEGEHHGDEPLHGDHGQRAHAGDEY